MKTTKENLIILERLHNYEKYTVFVSAILIALFVLLPISNDFFFIHNPGFLFITIGFRIGSAMLMWLYFFAYRARKTKILYRVIIPLLAIFALGTSIMLDLTRPKDYLFSCIPVFTIVSFYYFMMYSPLPYKIIPSLVISAEQIVVLIFYKTLSPQGTLSMIITLVLFNIFGISAAWVSSKLWQLSLEQEQQLRQDFLFKDALINASFEALILYRANRIVDCNKAFLDLVGQTMDEIRPKPVDQLIPLTGDQQAQLAGNKPVSALLYGKSTVPVELQMRNMTMANFDYHCLIIRKQDSAELVATRKLASSQELDSHIERLPLSKREREIVHEIVNGLNRYEIADRLFISEETVKKHTANVYLKLQVNSKIDLINRIMEK